MSDLNERFPKDVKYVPVSPTTTGGFWANLKLIRPVAWVVAIAVLVGVECIFWIGLFPEKLPPDTALFPKLALSLVPIILFIYVMLIGYVYVDAKRRGMRYVMWTLLATFINNFIGIIIYFLLRDPLPTPCPKCGHLARSTFSFCPDCGAELLRVCKSCHKKLEMGWVSCAWCGTPVGGGAQTSAKS
jgi:hypothetical protein